MIWTVSHRADPLAKVLADRHYSRQTPDSPQFLPPGRFIVILAPGALWVTSWPEFARHHWPGAWVNTLFRRERGEGHASDYIRAAVAATRARYGDPPPLGMITFVDASKVRYKRDPGRCYLRAGFRRDGETEGGLLAFRLAPEDMPPAEYAIGGQSGLFACQFEPSSIS